MSANAISNNKDAVNPKERMLSGAKEYGSLEERADRGRSACRACPIDSCGELILRDSGESAVALLEEQSASRIKELIPLRYERMKSSPFAFFRGAAIVMASDLASSPESGLRVQCIGDAHIANFGVFASPTRHLVFDVNDFDETAPGPWEWDVKRLAASVEVCARGRGFPKGKRKEIVKACVKTYRRSMEKYSEMSELDTWYSHLDVAKTLDRYERESSGSKSGTLHRAIEKAMARDNVRAADKLAEVVNGRLRFRHRPPELVPLSEHHGYDTVEGIELAIEALVGRYFNSLAYDRRWLLRHYRIEDIAQKVVGVGSVGTRSWVVLLSGKTIKDPLVMQVKEAQQSVVERYRGESGFPSHGERVVQGQRLVQSTSDILLGWTSADNPLGEHRDYYVRQLWNGKGSIDLDTIGAGGLENTARLCARALAHAHARTGDSVAISAYLGTGDGFDDAMQRFAFAYADQNQIDYDAFVEAIRDGRLPSQSE
ncbi:MAG TPA: DUF2252 domain-containing protein [Candidatus Merdibacter merdigallinarum]|nr:DUF2252 domain-containing protein [Candidatus Merdibacter merdigallinarum]